MEIILKRYKDLLLTKHIYRDINKTNYWVINKYKTVDEESILFKDRQQAIKKYEELLRGYLN